MVEERERGQMDFRDVGIGKVAITGASGFLGSHLLRRLIHQDGVEIHALSRSRRASQTDGVRWWQADLTDRANAQRILRQIRPDVIFHFSGLATARADRELVLATFDSLLVSTVNVLMAAADVGCRRLILAASLTEPQSGPADIAPGSPYAAAKWAGGAYARMFHKLYHLPVVMLRPYMTYGPGQSESKLIPHVITALLKKEAPRLSSGRQEIDWVYIDDVIDGFCAAATAPGIEGQTIDLGSGFVVPIRAVVGEIVELMDSSVAPSFNALPDRPDEPVRAADTSIARSRLGWKARTPLKAGLAQTIEWYRRRPEYADCNQRQ